MVIDQQLNQSDKSEKIFQAKQRLIDYMSRYDIPASSIKKMGELGMMTLKNKKTYSKFVQHAKELKIPGADQLSKKPDFQQIGSVIALAKLLET
jgi:hypothetical protein